MRKPEAAAKALLDKLPREAVAASSRRIFMPVVVFADLKAFESWAPDETDLTWEEHSEAAGHYLRMAAAEFGDKVECALLPLRGKDFARWLQKQPPQFMAVFRNRDFGLPEINKAAAIRSAWAEQQAESSRKRCCFTVLANELSPRSSAFSLLGVFTPDAEWPGLLERAGIKFIDLGQ